MQFPPPFESEPIAEDDSVQDEEPEPSNGAPRGSLATRRFRLDPSHLAYARASRQALLESFGPDATAPERLLLDLVAQEVPIAMSLVESEMQLAARLEQMLLRDDVKSVVTLAKALRQVSTVCHAVGRRVETVLSTAVALKAQRRLVELHRRGGAE